MTLILTVILLAFSQFVSASESCQELPLRTVEEGSPVIVLGRTLIPNFRRVNSYLYRGGQPNLDTKALEILKNEFNVTTIINLIGNEEPEWQTIVAREQKAWTQLTGNDDSFIHIPILNQLMSETPLDQMFETVAQIALAKRRGGNVFIHCKGGRDRTGVAVATVRLVNGCSYAATVEEYLNSGAQPYRSGMALTDYSPSSIFNMFMDRRNPNIQYIPSKILSLEAFDHELKTLSPTYQQWNKSCGHCLSGFEK